MGNKWEEPLDRAVSAAWMQAWNNEHKKKDAEEALVREEEARKWRLYRKIEEEEAAERAKKEKARLAAWHAGRTCGACGAKGHNRTKCPTVPYVKPAKPAKPWTKPYQPPSGPRVPVVVDARLSVGAIGMVEQFRAEDRRHNAQRLADEAGLSSPIEKTQAAEKPPGALDGVVTGRIGPTKEELIAELRK